MESTDPRKKHIARYTAQQHDQKDMISQEKATHQHPLARWNKTKSGQGKKHRGRVRRFARKIMREKVSNSIRNIPRTRNYELRYYI